MADHIVRDVAALEALYGTPGKASLIKVAPKADTALSQVDHGVAFVCRLDCRG